MRPGFVAGWAVAFVLAAVAALVLLFVFQSGTSHAPAVLTPGVTPAAEPTPTPLPETWIAGLHRSKGGLAILISCLDNNGDGRLNAADGRELPPPGVDIPLDRANACVDQDRHRDYYAGPLSLPFGCSTPPAPLLIYAIGGGGTELLDPVSGESLGLLDIVNGVQDRADDAGIATQPILMTAAIFGADKPQTRMEQWLTADLQRRLDAMPCLRAVLIGHSHGGVTVTSVTHTLDAVYGPRMFGVILDRTLALYDRVTHDFPSRTPILNVYQLNEGWHGVLLDAPNITNVDESRERAPLAPSEGGGPLAIVSHLTLDDSPGVQQRIIDRIIDWADRP